jgi:hypothetical protein
VQKTRKKLARDKKRKFRSRVFPQRISLSCQKGG